MSLAFDSWCFSYLSLGTAATYLVSAESQGYDALATGLASDFMISLSKDCPKLIQDQQQLTACCKLVENTRVGCRCKAGIRGSGSITSSCDTVSLVLYTSPHPASLLVEAGPIITAPFTGRRAPWQLNRPAQCHAKHEYSTYPGKADFPPHSCLSSKAKSLARRKSAM